MSLFSRTFLLISLSSFAFSSTYNNIDNNYKSADVEKGYHFYNENKKEEPIELDNKSSKESQLLAILIKEIRSVKSEMKKLNFYINPNAPHKINCSDGSVDWANSRPECFEMPMITEARNMPALSNFMQNPNETTASNWLGVQAQVFNRAIKMGYATKFAYLNGDENVYPVTTTHINPSIGNSNSVMQYKLKKEILKKHADRLGTVIFLGQTTELEQEIGPEFIGRLLNNDSSIFNPLLVFKSEDVKLAYDSYFTLKNIDSVLKKSYIDAEKQVLPEMFDNYNIRISPAILAVYKKSDDEILKTIISKGFTYKEKIINGLTQFLIFNNIIEPKEFNYISKWNISNEK